MNYSKATVRHLLIGLLIISAKMTAAQTYDMHAREWSSVKSGSSLNACFHSTSLPTTPACDTLLAQVDFFNNTSVVGSSFNLKELRSFVKFSIDHTDPDIYKSYTYQISYQLKGYKTASSTGATDVLQDTLMVNYNPDSINNYQDVHMRTYYGYFRIEVQILAVYDYTATYASLLSNPTATPPLPTTLYSSGVTSTSTINTNWMLEAGIIQQQFDLNLGSGSTPSNVYSASMSGISLGPTSALVPNTNTLRIKWDLSATQQPTPAMYELEWTYADDYDITLNNGVMAIGAKNHTNVLYDFRGNSTRVITNKTSYDLPLVYKRGYLIYRVRMLRPDNVNYQETKYSDWSNGNDHGTVGTGNGFYQIAGPHQSDLSNWNYEASYAEDGKSKQVLGYFDGLLKSRQTLTRFNSRPNELIGAEQFYDFEGRAGLQTLPVPVLRDSVLGYISGFARSASTGQPYVASDFDPYVAPGQGIPSLPGLHQSSAARPYYSAQNSLLGASGYNMMKAVPDAGGFPLLHTIHEADDPSRIKIQGSAGQQLQIGQGHETKYYYSDPEQAELNQYFGANIGKAAFYEKVITRDPNNELSFSVLNNAGKPTMTGLMGFQDTTNSRTLLNLDSVTAPTGPWLISDLFSNNPPKWNGSMRQLNKTFFSETNGGSLTYDLAVNRYALCNGTDLVAMNIPVKYGISIQGENDSTPIVIVPPTTVAPAYGSSTGPTVGPASITGGGTGQAHFAGTFPGSVTTGPYTLSYFVSYNPDHVDSAVKMYLREPSLYPGCFRNDTSFIQEELAKLPDDCSDQNTTIDNSSDYGASPCGQYEQVMKMQLKPMATYGTYRRMGVNSEIIVGNGQSLFAIVGWRPAGTGYTYKVQVPAIADSAYFRPTCFPVGITYPAGTGSTLNDSLNAVIKHYKPIYAYQYYLPNFSAATSYNGQWITIDTASSVDYVIEVFNSDVSSALLTIHPEYCQYTQRYCDATNYDQQILAIPDVQAGKRVQRFEIQDIVDADPFAPLYAAQNGNSSDGLKFMSYKLTNASGAITGSRDVAIDFFAYMKSVCDPSSDPASCWSASLPNTSGSPVNSAATASLVSLLPADKQEVYYHELLNLYVASRNAKVDQYRNTLICDPMLPVTDPGNKIFHDDFNANGDPTYTAKTPVGNITSGNFGLNMQHVIDSVQSNGSTINDVDEYALQIVKQLLNCRIIDYPAYSSSLFTGLLYDLKSRMRFNSALHLDQVWKGGVTPDIIKDLLHSYNIEQNDLCNPYLINYSLAGADPCKSKEDINFCEIIKNLDIDHSFLSRPKMNFFDTLFVNPITNTISGTDTVAIHSNNIFEITLAASLGYLPPLPTILSYSWSLDTNGQYVILFSNATHQVSITTLFKSNQWNFWQELPNGHLDLGIYDGWSDVNADSFYVHSSTCNCPSGRFQTYGCFDVINDDSTLWIGEMYQLRESYLPTPLYPRGPCEAITDNNFFKVRGLDISLLNGIGKDQLSRTCMHTCIACNELKDAYKVYQTEVATQYGIKGKGHPFYETSLKSFLNYYFRNRHYTDEYLNFIQGCSLTDSLFLPQYFGYFTAQASASSGIIDGLINAMRVIGVATPAQAPFASTDPMLTLNPKKLKFFYYIDANDTAHLYVDLRSVYTDERLLPYIHGVNSYIWSSIIANSGSSAIKWSFNSLNSEYGGQPEFAYDFFLPDTSTAFATSLSSSNFSVSSENVTVKDGEYGNTSAQLSVPFTHYRVTPTSTLSATDLAAAWGQLDAEVAAKLQTASLTSSVSLSSHESYRSTHGNSLSDKVSYLNYVYGLSPSTSHDSVLLALSAPAVQANAYTSGSTILKDVSYRHGIEGGTTAPSGTLQLMTHSGISGTTTGFTFLGNILEACKQTHATVSFPGVPPGFPNPYPSVAPGNPFMYAAQGLIPGPPNTWLSSIAFGTSSFSLKSETRIDNNGYSFTLVPNISGARSYHVLLRMPQYVSRNQAAKYNLVQIAPLAFGNSKRYFRAAFVLPTNTADTLTGFGKTDFDLVGATPDIYEHVMLCDEREEDADSIDICYDALVAQAYTNAANRNSQYQDSLYNSLRMSYRTFLTDTYYGISDGMTLAQPQMKYAVTLYSYDRAGNLITTTPPMGVKEITSQAMLNAADYWRVTTYPSGTPPIPAHTKQTTYTYSAQNQKLTETTPDGGLSKFIYDEAGRLVFSQNSKQAAVGLYTYSLYDGQNRVIETGQIKDTFRITNTQPGQKLVHYPIADYIQELYLQQYKKIASTTALASLITNTRREQVVRTTYDTALYTFAIPTATSVNNGMSTQDNLRSRVAAIASYSALPPNFQGYAGYDIALHYSYDLSGNLKTLTYDMPRLAAYRQQYKRIDYDYDLYSGKVTLVSYDRGFADQYYQRYSYDDDNRITKTETSRDGLLWDRDAEYKYYPHGPLARISLGDQRVQGIDFAYTLQGWLKSINGDAPDSASDIGGDGLANNAHQADLFRTRLDYFAGDYKPIDSTNALNIAGSSLFKLPAPPAGRSLYNGNIAAATTLPGYFEPLYTGYRYDKLNRIKAADYIKPAYASASPLAGAASGPGSLYHSNYAYDLDGNLTALNRYGYNRTSQQVYLMDSLYYCYAGGTRNNNRLTNYTDTAGHSSGPGAGFTNDIAKYGPPGAAALLRMQYDPTGNLTQDLSNGLTSIDWTLYGKTSKVVKDDGHTLTFTYDPLGNRFSKTVYSIKPGIDSSFNTEYYIREASGNILAIYRQQQHYYYYDPYAVVIANPGNTVPLGTLSGGLGTAFGTNGPFAAAIVSGTAGSMPSSYVGARVSSRTAGFYARTSAMARTSLAASTPDLGWRLAAYDTSLGARLYPAWAGYNGEAFGALVDGITDTAELERCAALLFSGSDSTAMHARYEAYRGGLDSGVYYSPANLGGLLASNILDWRSEPGGEAARANLKSLLWPADSASYSLDSSRSLYSASIGLLLSDSAYLQVPLQPGIDSSAPRPQNLDGLLRLTLAEGSGSLAADTAAVEGPAVLGRMLADYLGHEYSSGAKNDSAIAMLRRTVGDEVLLGAVYADSSTAFINNLLSNAGGSSEVAKAIVAGALKVAVDGSASGTGSPAGAMAQMAQAGGGSGSPFGTYLGNTLATALDYDRFYLAEHHLYGSSRLGIKKYWPYQYRYEWDKARTLAQNNAAMDSNDISYRMPWYNNGWQSLVSANETVAAGHANSQPAYSARILGQKNYELTDHLGNVKAVVSDKVTDDTLGTAISLPAPVVKRAGLAAAYDHYPFGMYMPDRYIEDNTVQCIPVTRTRMINQINYVGDELDPNNGGSLPFLLPGGPVPGSSPVTVGTLQTGEEAYISNGQDLEVYMDLPQLHGSESGLKIEAEVAPDGSGLTTVSLSKQTDPNDPNSDYQELTEVQVNNNGIAELMVTSDDYPVSNADNLRLNFHYSAASMGTSTPGVSAKLQITRIIHSVITKVVQSYVTLSCDTDGTAAGGYRFGFNGQMKDNEIAGAGNSLDFKFRGYDPRLGRFRSIDPLAGQYPYYTPYQFAGNRPIDCIDFEGQEPIKSGTATQVVVTNGGTAVRVSSELTVKVQILNLSSKPDDKLNMSMVRGYVGQFGQEVSGSHTATISTAFSFDKIRKQPQLVGNRTTDATYETHLTMETEVIHSVSEISNNAVVLGILDEVKGEGGGMAVGSDQYASALIPASALSNDNIASLGAKLISHELGHVFGLGHSQSGSMKTEDSRNQIGFTEKEKVEMNRNLIGNWNDMWNKIKSNPSKPGNLNFNTNMKQNFNKIKDGQ